MTKIKNWHVIKADAYQERGLYSAVGYRRHHHHPQPALYLFWV